MRMFAKTDRDDLRLVSTPALTAELERRGAGLVAREEFRTLELARDVLAIELARVRARRAGFDQRDIRELSPEDRDCLHQLGRIALRDFPRAVKMVGELSDENRGLRVACARSEREASALAGAMISDSLERFEREEE
jgi:hypothetical protein